MNQLPRRVLMNPNPLPVQLFAVFVSQTLGFFFFFTERKSLIGYSIDINETQYAKILRARRAARRRRTAQACGHQL